MAGRTYRYFQGSPLYPFGYGLSYTRFGYSNARLSQSRIDAGASAHLEVQVANLGDRDSDEIVQLYVSREDVGAPLRRLAAFQRVTVAAGAVETVKLDIPADAFAVVDDAGRRQIEPGRATLWVGGGQPAAATAAHAPGVEVALDIVGRQELPAL